jgi:hypothetical protein
MTPLEEAWTVVCPGATPVARPELLMVATVVFDELHVAVVVRFCVVPSLYVPVAVNGSSTPTAIVGLAGATAIETSAALLTVSVVDPLTDPSVTVIVVSPYPVLVANPVLLIVATPVFDELQLTDAVRNCVLPSLYVPTAVSCCVSPSVLLRIEGFAGVICRDTRVAADETVAPVVVVIDTG